MADERETATPRRFPPPWSLDDPESKLGQDCYIVRDADGHALAYVNFQDEPGRRSAAHLVTRDEARRIGANIARLPELLRRTAYRAPQQLNTTTILKQSGSEDSGPERGKRGARRRATPAPTPAASSS